MMLYPSIVDLLDRAGSKYSLVIAASKRAREICEEGEADGNPLDGARGITKAAEEIADGTITVINYEGKDAIIEKVLHNAIDYTAEEDLVIHADNVHDEEDAEAEDEEDVRKEDAYEAEENV